MARHLIKLNLARNCLRYVIKAYNIKEIYIPYYICPAIIHAVRKENCRIKFYHINKDFYPQTEFNRDEFILYPNYFGICAKQIIELNKNYKNLIADNAHNFYMKDYGLASFNSLRKFFNLKDGAFLNISKTFPDKFETDDYTYKPFSAANYNEFVSNELRLNKQDIKYISPVTEKYFSEICLEEERQKRLERFYTLHEQYQNKNELEINLTPYDVPFVYPYLTHNISEAKKLECAGYTILRYWNYLPEKFPEYEFYKYLIPVPLNDTIIPLNI